MLITYRKLSSQTWTEFIVFKESFEPNNADTSFFVGINPTVDILDQNELSVENRHFNLPKGHQKK